MHNPKWCLFFDFHTMPACPDVGAGFDFDAIADWFCECGVDFVVFPARCNLGTAYYNTEIGTRHPSLQYDLLGSLAKACHAKGIAISAYINVGLSHEEGLRHREWLVLPESGETYGKQRLDSFFRQMCYNTSYGDHVTAMAREVVEKCGVDGLFLDCMHTKPCIGVECIEKMKTEGVDWEDAESLHDFNYRKIVGMARRISEAARAVKPDVMLYFNGVDYEAQSDIGTYLEFECLPTGGWGYEMLPMGARYLRTLGKPVLNMTGRFHGSWGDFGGIRSEAALEYDCLYGLANGLRTTIGDHFHPRGDLNRAVMDLDRRIYTRLQKLEPWIDGAAAEVEVAVPMLMPYSGGKYQAPAAWQAYATQFDAIKAATRMLCELKIQFDVPSLASSWEKYRLLILPDFVTIDEEMKKRLRDHLNRGGAIISTGWSGLNPEREDFVFDEWGVRFEGENPWHPAYFNCGPEFREGMPDMPITLYDRGTSVKASKDTQVLATLVQPYHNRHWDGEHGFVYLPPDRDTGDPVVTLKGRVAHITHPVFTTYYNQASLPMRQMISNLMGMLLPEPMVLSPNAPSFSRITVTRQPGRRMVHVLAYLPEQRGAGNNMIEEPIELNDIEIRIRKGQARVERVYLAPVMEDLAFSENGDGYISVTIPRIRGHAVVVFEES
ncbi:beta-galactosidase trimerization domain-containing protein [bacterium]|nr:beta-galactosidase trimerization domain-containing protein [bacterium]